MTEMPYDEKILIAVAEEHQEHTQKESDLITLKSGVVLRVKAVPVLRVQAIINKFKFPPVPELWDEKKGRVIRNPDSAEYQEMRTQVGIERTMAIIDAIMATGTEIVSIPAGVPTVEDNTWVEELVATQVLDFIPPSVPARYLAWVKYVAIRYESDMLLVANRAGLNVGTSEAKVAGQLQQSFPH